MNYFLITENSTENLPDLINSVEQAIISDFG